MKIVVTSPARRPIVISLSRSKFYTNLVRFAPEVMSRYVQRLIKDHEPVPAELQALQVVSFLQIRDNLSTWIKSAVRKLR
ncbi:hypothetical protein DEV91_103156 [Phyllobacterium brassicacearum]|nr:hypothetical protein DEV91_103156 [Phyllobacterium brassicacearum]